MGHLTNTQKAVVSVDITQRGYELKLMVNGKLKKGAVIKQRLKAIIIQDRWEDEAKEYNRKTKAATLKELMNATGRKPRQSKQLRPIWFWHGQAFNEALENFVGKNTNK